MKKFFTLLLITLATFAFKTVAQNSSCNAGFDVSISGLSVNFIAAVTTDPTINKHYWKFGDGHTSTNVSPVHVYAAAGIYTIKHFSYRSDNSGTVACKDSVEKKIELRSTTISCNLTAGFTFERDPAHPNKVKFTNTSVPAADVHAVKWSFGDGTYSTDLNPTHTYATSGLYKVCLIVKKDNTCARDACAYVQVQVPPPACKLDAKFAWHADSTLLTKIHFINFSSHFASGDKIHWTFGDGTSSNDVNPTHTYTSPGTYNVCIRVEKKTASGTAPCVKEYCKKVVVQNECKLEANFTFEQDAIDKNKFYFKNNSTPVASIHHVQWNFGDGTSSNAINPDHVYTTPGIYNVCLKIFSSNSCYRVICKKVEIRDSEISCLDISKFTMARSSNNCLEFKFIPAVQNPNWKYIWSFGDGTGSTEVLPSHVYPRSGNYTVFLTVYKSTTCVSTSHKVAETGACFSCNNIWVKFAYKRESSSSNKIYFHTISNYPVLSQTYTITRLSVLNSTPVVLHDKNPEFVFTEPGDYKVCVRAITAGQCVKEYCEVIRIPAHTVCTLTTFPNPSTSHVSVSVQLEQPQLIHVYIYNGLNILMKRKDQLGSIGTNVVTTNIAGLTPGWYTIKVIYGNRVCYSRFQKI